MKQIITNVLLAVFALSGTNIFAQFRNVEKAVQNLANLERIIARAEKGAVLGRPVIPVPGGIIPGNAVGLLRVKMPAYITPVNKSYVTFLNKNFALVGPSHACPTPQSLASIAAHAWVDQSTQVVYESQTQLAKDLDAFYKGDADVYIAPNGHPVKFYSLPVDGILYKPMGYKEPVVLKSQKDFVIFDVQTKTGQIAENKPEVYNLFKPASDEELYGEFENFEVENDIVSWRPKSPEQYYRYERDLARNNLWRMGSWKNGNYPNEFESADDLGRELQHFYEAVSPKVKDNLTQEVFAVYEIPVQNIVYRAPGATAEILNPYTQVVLYNQQAGGRIVDRDFLENPVCFEFIK